jgi:short subunit dehydrogenase-like uncharacterized protein
MKTLMIYGAAGYTGRMVTEHAKAAGLNIIVAGGSEDALSPNSRPTSTCPSRVFSVDEPPAIAAALEGCRRPAELRGPSCARPSP